MLNFHKCPSVPFSLSVNNLSLTLLITLGLVCLYVLVRFASTAHLLGERRISVSERREIHCLLIGVSRLDFQPKVNFSLCTVHYHSFKPFYLVISISIFFSFLVCCTLLLVISFFLFFLIAIKYFHEWFKWVSKCSMT